MRNVNFGPDDFLPSLSTLSPAAEFFFRNNVTGLDIKSKYIQMSYLMSQLEERKSERRIKLATETN